jgi:endonuclease YncB( thermonuclease family)
MVSKKSNSKTVKQLVTGGAALLAVSTAGVYWKSKMAVPAYTVMRVIDGDTFETTEKQLIRLDDVDTPELELCGGPEAKAEMEKLVLDKPVYLKVMYRDKYMRLISLVYTPDGFINEKMVEKGFGIYRLSGNKTPQTEVLEKARQKAITAKAGVYGSKCTQVTNPDKPQCNIKGNVRQGAKTKIYSMPGCESYASTLVQLYLGDRWFCSEAEAKKAEFVKAGGCN